MNRDHSHSGPDTSGSTLGEVWTTFKTRWLHCLLYASAALAMAYLSVGWSADGFDFAVSERYHWAGVLIAICAVAVPEYMFITGHHRGNLTLTIGCLLGYVYGITSNWLGLWVATGMPDPAFRPALFALRLLLWVPTGVLLEVLPAPMLNSALGLGGGGFFTEAAGTISQLRAGHRPEAAPTGYSGAVQRLAHRPSPPEPPASHKSNASHLRPQPAAPGPRLSDRRESAPACPHCGSRRTTLRDGHFHCHRCHYVRHGLRSARPRTAPAFPPAEPSRPAKPQTLADTAEFSPEAQ